MPTSSTIDTPSAPRARMPRGQAAVPELTTPRLLRLPRVVEREGLENALENKRNSNLLICFEPKSPWIPLDPHIWH